MSIYEKEIKKDNLEIEQNKKNLIEDLKKINRQEIIENVSVQKIKKISFWNKIGIILGNGKNR